MNEKKISVIIPTYNRGDLLKLSLESLEYQTMDKDDYEVIICDDGSSDNTFSLIKEYEDKFNIQYCYHEHNGYRAALTRNMGIKLARGNICVFLDSGMIASKNFLLQHYKSHTQMSDMTIVVGYIYGFNISKESEKRLINKIDFDNIEESFKKIQVEEFRDKREYTLNYVGYDMNKWQAPWVYFWTGNISVKKIVLEEIGMFDESYNMWGGEDTDLGIRLYLKGINYCFSKEASAIHYPHPSADTKDNNQGERALKRKKDLYEKYKLKTMEIWLEVESKYLNNILHDSTRK